jgi:hypothetical protein
MTMMTKGGKKGPRTVLEDANFPSQQLMPSRIIVLKVRPLPIMMYWSTLLLHQGVHLVSSTFMLRYQEVPEGIQFACSSDFDDDMFRKSHDPALLQEVERLEKMDSETEAWYRGVALLL